MKLLNLSSVNEPLAGAIEHIAEGGNLSSAAQEQILRFVGSSNIDNRYEALMALVHFGGRSDLDSEACALLVVGLLRDDSDAYLGAVGLLGIMAARGNRRAARVLTLLSTDELARKELDLLGSSDSS